jgi:hypothetical protein
LGTLEAAPTEPFPDCDETKEQVPGLSALIVKFGALEVTEQMEGVWLETVTGKPMLVDAVMFAVEP